MNMEKTAQKAIAAEYQALRGERRAEIERRTKALYQKVPALERVDRDIAFAGVRTAAKIAGGKRTVEEVSHELMETLDALKAERARLYRENNIPEDYLEVPYRCAACKDTGYVDGRRCTCFLTRAAQYVYQMSGANPELFKSDFDAFRLDYYSRETDRETGISPYENAKCIYEILKNYCAGFDTTRDNLYLYGGTGLGKTFLASCAANALLKQGYGVLYQTAYRLFSFLEDYKFGRADREESRELYGFIYSCDLLIIDDLGTEFITPFSQAAFFDILNGRICAGKKIIISTNLSIGELAATYSTRVSSRVAGSFLLLKLLGEDIRMRR